MTNEQIVKAWGAGARIKNKTLQVRTRTDIRRELDCLPIGEAVTFLSGLDPEATLDIFAENDYGDYIACIYVDAWIDVTPEHRKSMVKAIETRQRSQRERDEREFRRLQATRPELFK